MADYTVDEMKRMYTSMVSAFESQLSQEKDKLASLLKAKPVDTYQTQIVFGEMVRLETYLLKAKGWLADLDKTE